MASAQLLAARKKGGAGHFLWLDEDTVMPLPVERYRSRREAVFGSTQMEVHAQIRPADHGLTEWWGKTTRPERTRPAPTVPLPMPAELAEALDELDDVAAYAEEIEVETPSAAAFDNARRLLKAMYRISPRRYSVYPMPDGYIAIDARGGKGRIAVVMCGSDGGVLCLVTVERERRRARYSSARDLPDGFIHEALANL